MDNPVLRGWVWDVPFYPFFNDRYRTLRSIFWYDSTQELEFLKGYGKNHEILIPEHLIHADEKMIKYVHDNQERIIKDKLFIIQTDHKGHFTLYLSELFHR